LESTSLKESEFKTVLDMLLSQYMNIKGIPPKKQGMNEKMESRR